jgi:hypothetical protein
MNGVSPETLCFCGNLTLATTKPATVVLTMQQVVRHFIPPVSLHINPEIHVYVPARILT